MVSFVHGQVASVIVLACLLVSGLWPGLALFFLTMAIVLLVDVSLWFYIKVCREPTKIRKEMCVMSASVYYSPSTFFLDPDNETNCQSTVVSGKRHSTLHHLTRCKVTSNLLGNQFWSEHPYTGVGRPLNLATCCYSPHELHFLILSHTFVDTIFF